MVSEDTEAWSDVDIVVSGCDIVTIDDGNTVIRNGAMAIDGGRIVWIGNAADASARYRGNSIIDGRNRIAIPGLIDAHLHTAQQLLRGKLAEIAASANSSCRFGRTISFRSRRVWIPKMCISRVWSAIQTCCASAPPVSPRPAARTRTDGRGGARGGRAWFHGAVHHRPERDHRRGGAEVHADDVGPGA